jgi:hypothetical protein
VRHAEPRGLLRCIAQQGRLADTCLAADDEDTAAAIVRVVQQLRERLAFAHPVAEPRLTHTELPQTGTPVARCAGRATVDREQASASDRDAGYGIPQQRYNAIYKALTRGGVRALN